MIEPVRDGVEPPPAPGPPVGDDAPAAPYGEGADAQPPSPWAPHTADEPGAAPHGHTAGGAGRTDSGTGAQEVPDPEQLPPLPPNAARPGASPGDVPPGAGPPQAAAPAAPADPGTGWAWNPPGEGNAPPEAWAPPHVGEPGAGTDTGGHPAARPPQGQWPPETAPPPGPQSWNPAPQGPVQPGPAPQGPPPGMRPGSDPGYPQGYDAYYDPHRQSGGHPGHAPAPPPGQGYGHPQAPGYPQPPATGAGGSPPSGAQPGFQYHAHFAEGVQPAQHPGQPGHPETAEDLRAENLVSDKRPGPAKGWRKVLHSATFGLVDVGESAAEQRRRELTERARTHVGGGHHRVAVLSLKGGVGKTTTTVALGSMLASLRGDRVLAVDANPDRGTLSDKVRLETAATIRDLLNEREAISRYADIRGFTSQALSRLEILASDRDPAVSEAFSEDDYREVSWLLEHYYSICLTDCGTGLLHSAMRGVLGLADQIVLVSSASVDGARSASATLDWLEAHQYGSLVRGAVVVLSMVRTGKSSVDLDRLEQHFASRCRAVVRVPWDAHLEEGAEVDLDRLSPPTRDAYLQLSATVGEAFAWPR
ncbi:nucleotide-binding protein [Streptomonospora litoralis]|uniref:nucleotide-binding protein n=1 Tax=Streptomonospora litoralis TaxID=2498135 RepID=UPI001F625444|nr:AAA family ATPase [Streptomonospora litoralis]